MRFDLHMHTLHSDGEKSVSELLAIAKGKELDGISITDHDTIAAYPEAFLKGEDLQLKVLSGIELSCLHHQKSVHLLGYSFSIQNSNFLSFLKKCQQMRLERNLKLLDKLNENNFQLTKEEMIQFFNKSLEVMGRPHFAKMLIEKGYCIGFQDAFNNYLGDGKKCYVVGHRPSVEEAIEELHNANAFAILAHPHLIKSSKLVKELLRMPLDGLEGYYARIMPQQEQKWVQIAKERRWIITGGSDYHGDCKPINEMGSSWISEDTFNILYDRQKENEKLSCY